MAEQEDSTYNTETVSNGLFHSITKITIVRSLNDTESLVMDTYLTILILLLSTYTFTILFLSILYNPHLYNPHIISVYSISQPLCIK